MYISEFPLKSQRIRVTRLLGPEVAEGVVASVWTLELSLDGALKVTGSVVKAEAGSLRVGLNLVLVGSTSAALVVARRSRAVRVREAGDADDFELWLEPNDHQITELRILFEVTGELVQCSRCGRLENRVSETNGCCYRCSYGAYMRCIKGL